MSTASHTPPESAESDGHHRRLVRWFVPPPLPQPLDPALLKHSEERAQDMQNRVADKITTFAGSMTFVYIHVLWFGLWIGLGVEKYPFGLLTMIVSLEAIFLSTFVMISQNRADAKRQVIADQQWKTVQTEDEQNPGAARPLSADTHAHQAGQRSTRVRRAPRVRFRRRGGQGRADRVDLSCIAAAHEWSEAWTPALRTFIATPSKSNTEVTDMKRAMKGLLTLTFLRRLRHRRGEHSHR